MFNTARKKIINDLFNKVLFLKARGVEPGYGSFVTMGFGNDMSYEIKIRGKMETKFRSEWFLWIYMCYWELKKKDQLLCYCEDEKVKMRESLKSLEDKKLLKAEILDDNYSMQLEFEDGMKLHLISNNSEEDNEQWKLFTPDRKVLTAGPFQEISYVGSGE